jgi:uncharacterized protein YcfJ
MMTTMRLWAAVALSVAVVVLAPSLVVLGQTNQVPSNTNPGNHAIYPAKGQVADQQMKDQLESYNWAIQQTGWDPYKAYDVLVQKGYAADQKADQAQGGAVSGAARGALVGVAVGAIAGDAGKGAAIGAVAGGLTGGMRSNKQRQAAEAEKNKAIEEFKTNFGNWDRFYVASMEGRGYTVK